MRCRALLALAVSLMVLFSAGRVAAAEAAGTVTALTGKALVAGKAGERPLAKGDAVIEGDLIQTSGGSRLTLRLGKATIVHLGPSTKLRVEAHLAEAGGVLELVDGGMVYDHIRAPNAGPSKGQVRSPYGLIAVRGTRFFAGRSKGKFSVFVDEGEVEVTAGGRSVPLKPGLGTDIAQPGAAPTPAQVWPRSRIRGVLLETTGRVRLPRR